MEHGAVPHWHRDFGAGPRDRLEPDDDEGSSEIRSPCSNVLKPRGAVVVRSALSSLVPLAREVAGIPDPEPSEDSTQQENDEARSEDEPPRHPRGVLGSSYVVQRRLVHPPRLAPIVERPIGR